MQYWSFQFQSKNPVAFVSAITAAVATGIDSLTNLYSIKREVEAETEAVAAEEQQQQQQQQQHEHEQQEQEQEQQYQKQKKEK